MMIQEAFGSKIKELRTNAMISQVELANRSGIDRAQISKIEKGTINVTLETIDKLCKALNMSVRSLMNIRYKETMHPFVKWAGGKGQILDEIEELLPVSFNSYFEPFVGGGALFFYLTPSNAYINDFNSELVCVYNCFKDDLCFDSMLKELDKHEKNHSEEYYLKVRSMDRDNNFIKLPIYIRAARMIYLNKTCFNGLFRVNSNGYFNVPSGKKEKVNTYDEENMEKIRRYFQKSEITVLNTDFEEAVKNAKSGDFVYFDPPYDVLNKTTFTKSNKVFIRETKNEIGIKSKYENEYFYYEIKLNDNDKQQIISLIKNDIEE